ncbi:MAG: heavy metal translocating P-type ATPase [Candidatus Pelagadaptatus aseana]|uniref:heavy metal translocating P-type ATPase n=1 Tax=Candidatus Pelagadaptatus aseana TaxID=3120508 RepID=UPI0039B1E769
MSDCYHCGLSVPPHSHYSFAIDGEERSFCCPGCQAVASAIVDGGLGQFYNFRTESSARPDEADVSFVAFDAPDVQREFALEVAPGVMQASLLLEGISCAACVWLIEKFLSSLEGVVQVKVNASIHRCLVDWDVNKIQLSQIMQALASIGYQPIPATEDRQLALQEKEKRQALMRLAIAGFGMMQVSMVAVTLYTGAEASWEAFFRWLSLIMATPVVFYSARPFFVAAWRAIKVRHLVMDVPVSLAIGGAYAASVWATLFGGGEVYFDSVSMFTFFLLTGRYLEMRARHRNGIDSSHMAQILPLTAQRWLEQEQEWQFVPLKALEAGDQVLVPAGSTMPCDGVVERGQSGVVEALLTGEAEAIQKQSGSQVIAGTINTESALEIRVTAVGQQTRLSAIERLVEQAQQEKPAQVAMADRLAGYFVAVVLVVAALVASVWFFIDSSKAFWVTLSVLVVTCPCALSLASPAALTTAIAWLRRHGLLVTRGHVLEELPSIDRVIFDKTGTLTEGEPQLVAVYGETLHQIELADAKSLLNVVAALEEGSRHPIARAFNEWSGALRADSTRQIIGAGVAGVVEGVHYRLGKPEFALGEEADSASPEQSGQWLVLAQLDDAVVVQYHWLCLQDRLRDSAQPLVHALKQRGIRVELLSGDASAEVERVAGQLGFDDWQANMSPDDKLRYVKSLQDTQHHVLMVGDGINDVPVLSGAAISVAMGGATDLAQTRADSILLSNDLMALDRAFDCAVRTRRIIAQNLTWALMYNGLALPLAAMALVPPYAAAIGMSLSSLLVVLNALRISKMSPH